MCSAVAYSLNLVHGWIAKPPPELSSFEKRKEKIKLQRLRERAAAALPKRRIMHANKVTNKNSSKTRSVDQGDALSQKKGLHLAEEYRIIGLN